MATTGKPRITQTAIKNAVDAEFARLAAIRAEDEKRAADEKRRRDEDALVYRHLLDTQVSLTPDRTVAEARVSEMYGPAPGKADAYYEKIGREYANRAALRTGLPPEALEEQSAAHVDGERQRHTANFAIARENALPAVQDAMKAAELTHASYTNLSAVPPNPVQVAAELRRATGR